MKPIDVSFTNVVPTSNAPAVSALIMPEQLETFFDLGVAAYREILDDAMGQIPDLFATIRDAIGENDIVKLNHAAHKVCGTLLTFGCVTLEERCKALQIQKSFSAGQVAAVHTELLALWEQTLAAIREWEKSVPDFAA
jgi:HPt (histidine-containing phosphotransfer) domain-containing protein